MTEWISCEERLPEHDEHVLGYDGQGIYIAWFVERKDKRLKNREGHFETDNMYTLEITHWIPIPDYPKE